MRDTKLLGLPAGIRRAVIITALAAGATLALSGCDQQPKQQAAAPVPAAAKPDLTKLKWHETPQPAPQVVFQDAAGKDLTLSDFAGKVLVVNLWATWCAPCVEEMPTLDALQGAMGGDKFQVLTISQDRDGLKVAQPFVEKKGWKNLALYVDPKGDFYNEGKFNALPATLLIDRQGREVARLEGTLAWNAPEVQAVLKELMAKPDLTKLKWREEPKPAPQVVFQDAAGKDHKLGDLAGKVLVVNLWATWCAPCVEEMPTLDALQAAMGGEKFQVLTINQDREGLKVAQPFAEKNAWKNLTLYVEPKGAFYNDAGLRGLPTTLLIDRQGREVARLEGILPWNAPEVQKVIKELIEKPAP